MANFDIFQILGLSKPIQNKYLKNMIDDAFDRAKIDKPYFLMGAPN